MKRWCSYLEKNFWYLLNTAKNRQTQIYSTTSDITVVKNKHMTKNYALFSLFKIFGNAIQYIKKI